MIVCICHGISEATLEQVIDEGATSLQAVQKQCGAGGDCGSCRFQIAKLIDEAVGCDKEAAEAPAWTLPLLQTG